MGTEPRNDPEVSPQLAAQIFTQVWEAFVAPAIELREAARAPAAAPFSLHRFQVVLPLEGEPQVRFDREVLGDITASLLEPAAVAEGQEILNSQIAAIESYTLPPEERGTSHVTAFWLEDRWTLAFDFSVQHPERHSVYEHARAFHATASAALAAAHLGPALDNAFSAAELFAKAEMLSAEPTMAVVIASRKHSTLRSTYNAWGRLGNTDQRFVKVLNQLEGLRSSARYQEGELSLTSDQIDALFVDLAAMDEHVGKITRGEDDRNEYSVFATRPITAGEMVGPDDYSLTPVKVPKQTTARPPQVE